MITVWVQQRNDGDLVDREKRNLPIVHFADKLENEERWELQQRRETRHFIDHVETCGRWNEFSRMNSTIHQNLSTGGGFANLKPKEENVSFSSSTTNSNGPNRSILMRHTDGEQRSEVLRRWRSSMLIMKKGHNLFRHKHVPRRLSRYALLDRSWDNQWDAIDRSCSSLVVSGFCIVSTIDRISWLN